MPTAETDIWPDRTRLALLGYAEPLLRSLTATLVKPRTPVPVEELIDRCLATLQNPPVVDRRIRELPPAARKILTILGLTRQPRWKVGHLLSLLATLGHAEGLVPIQTLLQNGLLFPNRPADSPSLAHFDEWINASDILNSTVFTLPAVATRAKDEPLDLPDLKDEPGPAASEVIRVADGLEWPLRLAAVTQLVAESPVRLTQARALFKRDLTRLQASEVLSSPPSDHLTVVPDLGVLCLYWAAGVGLLRETAGELSVQDGSEAPGSVFEALIPLMAALPEIENWDPMLGFHAMDDSGLSSFPSASVVCLLLLARSSGWVRANRMAEFLWEHHPSWSGGLSKEAQKTHGEAWAEAFLCGVAYPLRLVEVLDQDGRWLRLSDLGKSLLAGGASPPPPPAFPQTLMVQPNAEILAYRQGLTPPLIARLTRLARWKAIGPACTLELTAEQTYRGLESGLTLSGIVQTLNQHGVRPVPPPVVDLLQRWANKRERISVYPSATLVEFQSSADLDTAISRGLVAVRVTDRIGLCSDGGDPDFKHLRLIGNRDYESRPAQCVSVAEDGVTLTVDAPAADLLFEADVVRFAELVPNDPPGMRRYRLTPALLRKAIEISHPLDELDAWFVARTGSPLPPAARMFVQAPQAVPARAVRRLVLALPTAEIADGIMQWPATRAFVEERLGPVMLAVDEVNFSRFVDVLRELGLKVDQAG